MHLASDRFPRLADAAAPLVRAPERGPLWAQLKSSLLDFIAGNDLAPHSRLPSEADLCARFSVSRTVVREALNQLVIEGHVYRIQGKGSFVSPPREDQDFVGTTVGFTSDFIGKNRQLTRRVLAQSLREATPREAKFLRLRPGEPVVGIDRLLSVDRVPRLLVHTAILASAAPSLETTPLENRSLYETLRRQYGIVFRHAERWLEAINADEALAQMLAIEAGAAVLKIESVSFGHDDTPLEYYVAYHRTDQSRLHFRVR